MNIRDVASKYLAPRPRTCGEMRKHLKEKEFNSQAIEELISDFLEIGYLDDSDYCRMYVNLGFEKGKGSYRVRQELLEKGVDNETIQIALEDYEGPDTELQRAMKQAEKIVAGNQISEKLLGKIGRRLTSLGYSADVVYQVVGKYMRGKDE